ncbi:retrovirus-related Pol polyprotein from transposon RE1 [Trichonephila clavipes]|nr:retrovirus-related Pol polyprotein from transposon RE1 [Trichonephila clavipes]
MEDIKRSLRTSHKSKGNSTIRSIFWNKIPTREDVGIFISRVKTAATRLQEAGHKLDDLYIGFQLIRWLPQEFQSTVQQIYRWKEEDFRVVKIEAELILEANRLQLIKQDLEKADNAYLSSFTSKKSKTLPGATAAAHGNPNGKNDYQKKSGKDEDYFDRVKDTLTSRLVSKTSTETPSTSEKPDESSENHSLIPCTEVKWIRNIGRKVTGSNVYYSIEGEATRLKSFNEIERYYLSEQQEALMVEITIPNCYKQAIRSRDASKWHDAMDKEINVMIEHKVWDLIDHPDNIKLLENRWVYTIKYDQNKIVRYKARLVARGNTQLRNSDSATNRNDRVSMGGFITFIDETQFHSEPSSKNPLVCRPWKLSISELLQNKTAYKEIKKSRYDSQYNSHLESQETTPETGWKRIDPSKKKSNISSDFCKRLDSGTLSGRTWTEN